MDFSTFLFLIAVTVILPIVIIKMGIDFKRKKMEMERDAAGPDAGMTLGELKRLLRDTVEEANAPLLERIEVLEREAHSAPDSFDPYDAEPLPAAHDPAKTVGRAAN